MVHTYISRLRSVLDLVRVGRGHISVSDGVAYRLRIAEDGLRCLIEDKRSAREAEATHEAIGAYERADPVAGVSRWRILLACGSSCGDRAGCEHEAIGLEFADLA
jgi:hypothetical protein